MASSTQHQESATGSAMEASHVVTAIRLQPPVWLSVCRITQASPSAEDPTDQSLDVVERRYVRWTRKSSCEGFEREMVRINNLDYLRRDCSGRRRPVTTYLHFISTIEVQLRRATHNV